MTFVDEISARIRAWRLVESADLQALVQEAIGGLVAMFGAEKVVAAWELREEPGLTIHVHTAVSGRCDEIADVYAYRPLVDSSLEHVAFRSDARGLRVSKENSKDVAAGIHAGLAHDYGIYDAVAVPLSGELVEGELFIVRPGLDDDDAICTALVASSILTLHMDSVIQQRALREDVAAEERMRVARDLHDGLLQSFTGVVLQLETVHALVSKDPVEAGRLLTQVQATIMADQRELRAYVERLRPRRRAEMKFDFAARLQEMTKRFEEQWGIAVDLSSEGVDPHVGGLLGHETYRIVQEAVTNSARHGAAKRVDVRLQTTDGMLVVDVSDDGIGLPVRGRLTLAEMRERGVGPASLGERVAALNGQLTAWSTDSGLKLEITLPLGWAG